MSRTSFWTLRKSNNAINPENTGETTQLAAMEPTWPQLTESSEIPTTAKPTIAPTMECVVDTGQPRWVATSNHTPAASRDDNIPYTSNSGFCSSPEFSRLMMPLRTVSVTSPPASAAPANSNTIAMRTACLMVIARAPTEVPMALATSLAPTPQAMKKPKITAMARKIVPY